MKLLKNMAFGYEEICIWLYTKVNQKFTFTSYLACLNS